MRPAHCRMRIRATVGAALAMVSICARPGLAQEVDETRAALRDGTVKISVAAGTVRIIGWERDSVRVSGNRGRGVSELRFEVEGPATGIRLIPDPEAVETSGTSLEIRVPRASQVAVRTASASVQIDGVAGTADVTTISGAIRVSGAARSVYAESGTGDIALEVETKLVRAHSVDGRVTVRGARGFLDVSTVSGDIELRGSALWEGEVTSVSGDVRFEGTFEPGAEQFYFENHEGLIELRLPEGIRADFAITTYGGQVRNELFDPSARTFSTGRGGPQLRIKNFKGSIRLLKAAS